MSSGMRSQLFALCFDADEPRRLAQFWSGLLGWESTDDPGGGVVLLPSDDTGFRIRFLPTQERKLGQNRMHFDLTSTSLEEQQQTVAKALGLGAQHIDIGQLPEEGHVVLADPEGNEFCVIKAGNNRLHFDLVPPVDGDQRAEVDRLLSLGATRIDIGQGEVSWVVLADPDGNEFCVLTPR